MRGSLAPHTSQESSTARFKFRECDHYSCLDVVHALYIHKYMHYRTMGQEGRSLFVDQPRLNGQHAIIVQIYFTELFLNRYLPKIT